VGYYGAPDSRRFKLTVRANDWKYVFLANGGREQLFHLGGNPAERHDRLREQAAARLDEQGVTEALDGGDLRERSFVERDPERIQQFNHPVDGFPENPADVLED